MFHYVGQFVPKPTYQQADVFNYPPCERRAAYRAQRTASGWGSAPTQFDVVKVQYLPQYEYDKVIYTIASEEFLKAKQSANYAICNQNGSLINVSSDSSTERPNFWASLVAGHDHDIDPLYGQFYWVPINTEKQTWWRTSVQYDADRMLGLRRKHQANLRCAVHQQIASGPMTVGPFFVETTLDRTGIGWDLDTAWFDIYAPTESALVAIVASL
jgi:hypothetical protein